MWNRQESPNHAKSASFPFDFLHFWESVRAIMTEPHLDTIFSSAFTQAERQFLYANEEFKAALARASKDNIEKILQLGVQMLLTRGYVPPASPLATPTQPVS